MNNQYCSSLTKFSRRKTSIVSVGNVQIGSDQPYCLQTMTNTPTSDIEATADQVITAFEAGSNIVRITVPSLRDVECLKQIKNQIIQKGYTIPLVADIHFNQKIAFEAAKVVEKVRINPGNFADSKKFEQINYTNEEYKSELKRIEEEFIPLLQICRENNTALRIGTNHGSLSDRIMSRFGDTPEGMAESAMEFLRICKQQHFENVLISMKASNTMVMVQATRLLVAKMNGESMNYPLHLGVTEAGEGEDGRIKSAVGVGTLLADGIGDTIRISLTEPPECEIPVARKLAGYFENRHNHAQIPEIENYPIDPFHYRRRKTNAVLNIGGNLLPTVIRDFYTDFKIGETSADYISYTNQPQSGVSGKNSFLKPSSSISDNDNIPLLLWKEIRNNLKHGIAFIEIYADEIDNDALLFLSQSDDKILVLNTNNFNGYADQRAAIVRMINAGVNLPVILKRVYAESELENFQLKAAADLGGLFLDGLADGIWLSNTGKLSGNEIVSTAFGILQASRMRMTKPEYISCPSCGRTMFNLQETTKRIREKTTHLKGLKIGIMGCIVNGLGEMADADYGYIGSGIGKVNLYHKKELIKKAIPENDAVEELIALIKIKGDWVEPA
jgi:(E)-4-hydroxy-3-methylbut-2-enyl-diphosphate synthase